MSEFKTIIFEKKEGIGLLTLNRPERLNALSLEMTEELLTLFNSLVDDYECRVVVMTGVGRAFCSGTDLKNMSNLDYGDLKGRTLKLWRIQKKSARIIAKMREIPQPVIAAVNGVAAGGGLCLTLPADVRLAGKSAKFNAGMINWGMTGADMGTAYFLPRIVGFTRASEILLTGRFVEAEEALRIGLVTQVTEDEEVLSTAMEIAKSMLEKSVLGLSLTKEALNVSFNMSLEGVACIENRNQVIAGLDGSWEDGLTRFMTRRESM